MSWPSLEPISPSSSWVQVESFCFVTLLVFLFFRLRTTHLGRYLSSELCAVRQYGCRIANCVSSDLRYRSFLCCFLATERRCAASAPGPQGRAHSWQRQRYAEARYAGVPSLAAAQRSLRCVLSALNDNATNMTSRDCRPNKLCHCARPDIHHHQ